MTDMTERKFYNDLDDDNARRRLRALNIGAPDVAADFWTVTADDQHAPGFDEWNALRLSQGQRMGSFTEYMREIAPMLADDSNQW